MSDTPKENIKKPRLREAMAPNPKEDERTSEEIRDS